MSSRDRHAVFVSIISWGGAGGGGHYSSGSVCETEGRAEERKGEEGRRERKNGNGEEGGEKRM